MKRINISTVKYPDTFVLVDDADFERINQFKWCCVKDRNCFYAVRAIKKKGKWTNQKMTHKILSVPRGLQVDHKNRNGLDNRKSNLRICTLAQNVRNRQTPKHSSKYKGVSWSKISRKWRAYIEHKGKFIHLGLFLNEIDAAKAYDEKAKQLFGEFANLNFSIDNKMGNTR